MKGFVKPNRRLSRCFQTVGVFTVNVTRSALTNEDVRVLVKGATADQRAAAAHKLCRAMEQTRLSDEDRDQAQEILRIMAADAAELVRRAMAVTLKTSDLLPRDVAMKLARDVESVALPLLTFSPVFTDEDLAEVVQKGGPTRQLAIAKRPQLSEKVTSAISTYGAEGAVMAAATNDNARFSERGLQMAVERFAKSEQVLAAVAYRNSLPLSVTERLIEMVGDQVRDHLINHHQISPETALKIALGAKERATVDLVDQAGRVADLAAFTAHLHRAERLTPSLLLRALAHGHIGFLEWGLCRLSGIPHHKVWLMVHDAGPLGLRAIYDRAELPQRLYPAFRAGVDAFHALELEEVTHDSIRFQEKMLQRFLTQPNIPGREDVDYLLDRMDRISRENNRAAAGAA